MYGRCILGRIKSAYEKAMERYQQKAVSEEDIRKWNIF